jgi:hypothetical protein
VGFWILDFGFWIERRSGWQRFVSLYVVFALLALLGGGVFGGSNPVLGDGALLSGNGTLVCSEVCAQRGQCGTTVEVGTVVLLHSGRPSTRDHDVAIPANTPVVITGVLTETMAAVNNPAQTFLLYYYNVAAQDGSFGWAPGWCVQGP